MKNLNYGFGKTKFGKAVVCFSKYDIYFLEFYDCKEEALKSLKKVFKDETIVQDDKKSQKLLDEIFIENRSFNLKFKGTPFQEKVWKELLKTKKGELLTYLDIAKKIDNQKAVRAVANAIGANKIAYLVPCHRVIRKDDKLGGYKWGIPRKKAILEFERKFI